MAVEVKPVSPPEMTTSPSAHPCLIGMKACVGAHHLGRQSSALDHDVRLMLT